MRDHIELQIRAMQCVLQTLNATYQLARVANIVLSPVVRENVEGIFIAVRTRIVPFSFVIPGIGSQGIEQVSVDINFRKQAREFYCLDEIGRASCRERV